MLFYFLLISWINECLLKNYVIRFDGTAPIVFFRRIRCEIFRTIKPYHVCVKNNNFISQKDVFALSLSFPRLISIYEDKGRKIGTRFFLNDPDVNKQSLYAGFIRGNLFTEGQAKYSHDLYKLWEQGINGQGVVVAVVDDGVSVDHIDLRDNFDPKASYNFIENIPNPNTITEKHGTKCVGLISSVGNNSICGVGVAYRSRFGALRIMSAAVGDIRDSDEAMAFSFAPNYIRIKSMSWGPMDDGEKIGRPNELASHALRAGMMEGFNGLGTIFVYSSGNGGRNFDFCGLDGYLQMIEVLVIASMSPRGTMPPYGERCTAISAATLSNEFSLEGRIYTTEPINQCGNFHSGTSVSSPIAAGIIALTLQVNPNLSSRDVHDLIIKTSIQTDPYAFKNAAGLKYSLNFGFGLMDAHAMTAKAKNFESIPPLKFCRSLIFDVDESIIYGGTIDSYIFMSACQQTTYNVSKLETAVITVTIEIDSRHALRAYLTSPSGTRLPILESRNLDKSPDGLTDWDIKVMGFYGENPYGIWKLEVAANYGHNAKLVRWGITLLGTSSYNSSRPSEIYLIRTSMCSPYNLKIHKGLTTWCSKLLSRVQGSDGEDIYSYYDNEMVIKKYFDKRKESVSFLVFGSVIVILIFVILAIFTIYKIYPPLSSDSEYRRRLI